VQDAGQPVASPLPGALTTALTGHFCRYVAVSVGDMESDRA
jgi:hypothetical protein